MIRVARCRRRLRRWSWRGSPGRVREIEKFSHVVLRRVSRGKAWQFEPCLNELQYRGVVSHRVRDEVLLAEGRDYDQRNAVPCPREIVVEFLTVGCSKVLWRN